MGHLTRQDYEAVADVMIKLFKPHRVSEKYINEFVVIFKKNGKNFDEKKFRTYISKRQGKIIW